MAMSEIKKSLSNEEIEKYFNECMTGGEAYKVLERMLWKWYGITNDDLYITLITQMIRPDSQEDWAISIQEMLECRKDGMRASIWENEKIPMGSCNCKNK
jgi:hypothetical protein